MLVRHVDVVHSEMRLGEQWGRKAQCTRSVLLGRVRKGGEWDSGEDTFFLERSLRPSTPATKKRETHDEINLAHVTPELLPRKRIS